MSKGNISYLRKNDYIILDVITIIQKYRKKLLMLNQNVSLLV